jgi:hypothetical protein
MSRTVKENVNLLRVLTRLPPSARARVIEQMDQSAVCSICECAQNTLKGNVKLSASQKRRLSRYRNVLRRLCKPGESWKAKKKIIKQGGGFIIPLLLPVLANIIKGLIE